MRVVVGLGNPGSEYVETRHNVGFRVVAALAQRLRTELLAGRGDFATGSGRLSGQPVRLLLPLTYMNESGRAVRHALEQWECEASDLLVVCDDVHLPLGHVRLRRSGGPGGHNGLSSIIEAIRTDGFSRLRLGIGESPDEQDQAEYVLSPFEADERATADAMVRDATAAIEIIAREGFETAMNRINRKVSGDREDA